MDIFTTIWSLQGQMSSLSSVSNLTNYLLSLCEGGSIFVDFTLSISFETYIEAKNILYQKLNNLNCISRKGNTSALEFEPKNVQK